MYIPQSKVWSPGTWTLHRSVARATIMIVYPRRHRLILALCSRMRIASYHNFKPAQLASQKTKSTLMWSSKGHVTSCSSCRRPRSGRWWHAGSEMFPHRSKCTDNVSAVWITQSTVPGRSLHLASVFRLGTQNWNLPLQISAVTKQK